MQNSKLDYIVLIVIMLNVFIFLNSSVIYANKGRYSSWEEIVVKGNISNRNYNDYMLLFKEENFQLIGKLMTLFLLEEEKGYKITQIKGGPDNIKRFAIQSRKTIKESSYIDIHVMNRRGFIFTGKLFIEKVVAFDCDIKVELKYIRGEKDVVYQAEVKYDVPSLINGVNSLFSAFSGEDYISGKLINFIDNLHLVLSELDRLESEKWYKMVYDNDLLSSLIYPVRFTDTEVRLIANMIKYNYSLKGII